MLHRGREIRVVLRVSVAVDTRVRRASPADAPAIRGLLVAAQLPVADLDGANVQFWVVGDGSLLIGAIGLERAGAAGLLRSLVVAPSAQNGGVGRDLVTALEDGARAAGLNELVLLTQTAESFFRRRGFATADRAHVPEGIGALAEFRSLCPASAICMRMPLERGGGVVDG